MTLHFSLQLQTKERILNEKEAELADFQVELSRKGRENAEVST